ncbi:GNS1/SUR4 family-domain-containing protein [Cercophora scortea]|uniref:Elongation of fatty acids protein n=1 Tax=Cercophora scortea TaxID=314031 RepID=A0AAE0ILJ3_9PEZI|nr:GNS1/SUR4 family-domain-containing protein [Cercophora scortea]
MLLHTASQPLPLPPNPAQHQQQQQLSTGNPPLWPLLNTLRTRTTGSPATEFEFTPPGTPLSTLNSSVMFVTLFYAMIISGTEWMRHRKPFKLQALFLVHNLFLSLLSAFLLALFAEQLMPILRAEGTLHAICDRRGGWTQPLVVLYYLNYLTKYLELLDNVFLILKKKPLKFLHYCHHGATALLCYTQLAGSTPVSWVPITLNLAVHIVMYAYYFLAAATARRVTWKAWVTRLQIAQFVVDLGFVYFTAWNCFASRRWPWLPHASNCPGDEAAAVAGVGILTAYLVLFVSFYYSTYLCRGVDGGKGVKPRRAGGEAEINVHGQVPDENKKGANGNGAGK